MLPFEVGIAYCAACNDEASSVQYIRTTGRTESTADEPCQSGSNPANHQAGLRRAFILSKRLRTPLGRPTTAALNAFPEFSAHHYPGAIFTCSAILSGVCLSPARHCGPLHALIMELIAHGKCLLSPRGEDGMTAPCASFKDRKLFHYALFKSLKQKMAPSPCVCLILRVPSNKDSLFHPKDCLHHSCLQVHTGPLLQDEE